MKAKNIVLIAHDHLKIQIVAWVKKHQKILRLNHLSATGSTGKLVSKALKVKVHAFKHGPLGGDLQVGAAIAEGKIDLMIFFIDALSPQPHDVDVKALVRVATVSNIPFAMNPATADLLLE